jgi:DNA (cytosine-5)-methyltransferase 1
MAKKIMRYGELFCGPGGFALGAINASKKNKLYTIKHAWANDIDEWACKTYAKNICKNIDDESVVPGDIRDPKQFNIKKQDPIDILAFGFPCNDYSLVGEQKGIKGAFGPLYTFGVQALDIHTPDVFVAENVSGLSSSNDGQAFKNILKDLIGVGYRLTVNKFRFEQYGIPQRRHRIVIVGLNEKKYDYDYKVPKKKNIKITCKTAIEDPPIPEDAYNHELTNHHPHIEERLSHILPGQNVWNAELPDKLKLNVKKAKLSQIYRRLDPKEPAYTVTGSGGGGTHMYHYNKKECRALTNRERARLQTFPDTYEFAGGKEQVRKQIGMAVPVDGAEIIFTSILKTLSHKNYYSIDPSIGYFSSRNIDDIDLL